MWLRGDPLSWPLPATFEAWLQIAMCGRYNGTLSWPANMSGICNSSRPRMNLWGSRTWARRHSRIRTMECWPLFAGEPPAARTPFRRCRWRIATNIPSWVWHAGWVLHNVLPAASLGIHRSLWGHCIPVAVFTGAALGGDPPSLRLWWPHRPEALLRMHALPTCGMVP